MKPEKGVRLRESASRAVTCDVWLVILEDAVERHAAAAADADAADAAAAAADAAAAAAAVAAAAAAVAAAAGQKALQKGQLRKCWTNHS